MEVPQTITNGRLNRVGLLEGYSFWSQRALHLCDMLETLADELPKRVAPFWREAEYQVETVLCPYFHVVCHDILPKLRTHSRSADWQLEVLLRLGEDAAYRLNDLQDLREHLSEGLHSPRFEVEPEALGYALRGHFEAIRRDLNWHIGVLWPLAAQSATEDEISEFARTLHAVTKNS